MIPHTTTTRPRIRPDDQPFRTPRAVVGRFEAKPVSLSCSIDEHGACFHPEQCGCSCHYLD